METQTEWIDQQKNNSIFSVHPYLRFHPKVNIVYKEENKVSSQIAFRAVRQDLVISNSLINQILLNINISNTLFFNQ